jgi:hypothetical protein
MPKITAFLNDVAEERERRARRVAAAAIIFALLALAAAMRPDPKPVTRREIITVTNTVIKEVTKTEYRDRIRTIVTAVVPAGRDLQMPESIDPQTRHLCLSPRWVNFVTGTEQRVTVSNPSPGEIGITRIKFFSDRAKSGFDVDASECRDRILREGEQCTIAITLRQRIGETMTLLVAHDANREPELMTVEALE